MSEIFKQDSNWVIIDSIGKDTLEFARSVLADTDENDWSQYTSAKGPKSKQQYIINPVWMPSQGHKEPAKWPELRSTFETLVQRNLVLHSLMPGNWQKLHACSAWTVVGEEGSYHTIHEHGPQNVCSVTYLEVPKDQEYPAGQLYFVMHGASYNSLSVPATRIFHINPQPGTIVIFPSWMLHGVYPQGPGIRQTLNIDFNGDANYRFDTPHSGGASFNYIP